MNWIGWPRSIDNSLTGTMTDIVIDPAATITKHAAVHEGEAGFVTAMKSAANRAFEQAIKAGRKPVMVEVIVRVAPLAQVA